MVAITDKAQDHIVGRQVFHQSQGMLVRHVFVAHACRI